jgi:hypothetical protein
VREHKAVAVIFALRDVPGLDPGEPMIREILLTCLAEGIGLALDRTNKRTFVSDLGGFVRAISLDHRTTARSCFPATVR